MTSFALKVLGIIIMCIDHIGFMFFPNEIIYRLIGRIAMPIFAFQLAVGYSHTKNKEKHIIRMLIFAIISQIPFSIFAYIATSGNSHLLNIGFTFVLGLLGMYVLDSFKNIILKIVGVLTIILLSHVIPVDYSIFGVALCIMFYLTLSSKWLTAAGSIAVILVKILTERLLWRVPTLYALVPILFYNGKQGLNNKFSKYLFYVFYPVHLFVFILIHQLI